MILRQLIEIRVDTEKFDLTAYRNEAEAVGFENSDENGIWYFAEDIANWFQENGVTFQNIPNDPHVGES